MTDPAATDRSMRSVLVVDDDPDDLLIAERALTRSGATDAVLTCRSAEEALALLGDPEASRARHGDVFPPRLVLLDINMPTLDGFELLERLARLGLDEASRPGAIVMLSSSAAEHDRARAASFPEVQGYLVKPLTRQGARALAEAHGEPA